MKFFFILICIFLLIEAENNGQNVENIYDLEDVNKTIVLLEHIFVCKGEKNNLSNLCSEKFLTSKQFGILLSLIDTCFLNFGYTQEVVEKQFSVENSKKKLVVLFQREENNFWYIKDSYVYNERKKSYFKKFGFKPLAIEYNFIDFIDTIKSSSIHKYSGLAPNGRLPISFLQVNKFYPSQEAILYISDIIIHDKNRILGVSYLTLKYQRIVTNGKRGWLIEDFGYMNHNEFNSVFVDFLSNDYKKYDLNKKSRYYYVNIKN